MGPKRAAAAVAVDHSSAVNWQTALLLQGGGGAGDGGGGGGSSAVGGCKLYPIA